VVKNGMKVRKKIKLKNVMISYNNWKSFGYVRKIWKSPSIGFDVFEQFDFTGDIAPEIY